MAVGQGLRYSQAYVLSSNINPSLTGLGNSYKFGLLHRNQWSKLPSNLLSTGLNLELTKESGDLAGAIVLNQTKSTSALVENEFGLTARKTVSFGDSKMLHFGVSALYGSINVAKEKLVFGDQLNTDGSISEVTAENIDGIFSKSYVDIMSGVSVNVDGLFFGVSAKYLNRPNRSLMGGDYKQPMHLHFFSAYHIHSTLTNLPFSKPNEIFEIGLRPFMVFETQNGYSSIDLGIYATFDPVLLGVKYRGLSVGKENDFNYGNKDALSIILGYELEKVSITYSYDIIFTELSNSGGTHELGLIFRKPLKNGGGTVYF